MQPCVHFFFPFLATMQWQFWQQQLASSSAHIITKRPFFLVAFEAREERSDEAYDKLYVCGKCREGCETCVDDSPCLAPYNWTFRYRLQINEGSMYVVAYCLHFSSFQIHTINILLGLHYCNFYSHGLGLQLQKTKGKNQKDYKVGPGLDRGLDRGERVVNIGLCDKGVTQV